MTHATVETLLYVFSQGTVPVRSPVLFFRGEPLAALPPGLTRASVTCIQSFRPTARQLIAQGYPVTESPQAAFPLVWFMGSRHRDENLATFARGMALLEEGGLFLGVFHNDQGAKRYERALGELAGEVQSLSKFHCRAFWATRGPLLNQTLLEDWSALNEYQPMDDTGLFRCPGVFSADRIDRGSQLLCKAIETPLAGRGADLGAGIGALSKSVLSRSPEVTELYLVEAEARALEAARRALHPFESQTKLHYCWIDVASELATQTTLNNLDWVVMNPPFHIGASTAVTLGERFIEEAARILRPGGVLWMVANLTLPYEKVLQSTFQSYDTVTREDGYKVLRAVR